MIPRRRPDAILTPLPRGQLDYEGRRERSALSRVQLLALISLNTNKRLAEAYPI